MPINPGCYIEDSPEYMSHVFPAELTPEQRLNIYIEDLARLARLRIAVHVAVTKFYFDQWDVYFALEKELLAIRTNLK